jgi:two-component system sensor histidine kinase CpxA
MRDELGQLARTFDKMADRIQTLLGAERQLLLDISHELRSPLARLSVATELARSQGTDENHLNRIQKEADRLNALVGELLQVTRAEGDTSKLRFEDVDLSALIQDVTADCRIEAEVRNCRIEEQLEAGLHFEADPELLRRAIENVVRNAIRYTHPGTSIDLQLQRTSRQHGQSCAQILIRDHGPGVPPAALNRIFDPFYRVQSDRDRATGGVGLGLAIARRAIELHQGNIQATNVTPGLLVTITLPINVPVNYNLQAQS